MAHYRHATTLARALRALLALTVSVALLSCSRGARLPGNDPVSAAQRHLADGDTARAIDQLERTDLEKLQDPSLLIALGSLYRTRGTIDARLRSQRHLERALQLFPDNPAVLMELGRTYYEQTFYPDAERCFRAALALDPDLCEAHYFLGVYRYDKWKRVNEYTDDLASASGEFARALACDPNNADAARRYAFSLYALRRPDSAAAVCDTMIARFPGSAEFRLLRGAIAYDRDRYEDAASDFAAGVELLDRDTRAAYDDIGDLIPDSERNAYTTSAPDMRAVYNRAYWVDADPDPTTARNERALEHVYRTFLADLFYSSTHPRRRGWDTERGQAVIKFGWPDSIASTMGGSWKDGRVQTWTYNLDGAFLEFVFVDEYLNGNLRIPYRADAMVGVLRYAPLVSEYDPEVTAVPGTMDVVAFKDTDMSGALYIAMRVDADSLDHAIDIERTNHFYFRGTLFDDDWRPEVRFADTVWTSDTPPLHDRDERSALHALRAVPVPFDHYHVACTFEDEHGRASAQFRAEGDTYRFAGDRLAVSDVLLQRPDNIGPALARGERILHPNAGRHYRAGERVRAYFEVYNLRVAQGRSDYSVTFLIYDAPAEPPPAWRRWGGRLAEFVGVDRQPSISQTFERAGIAHREAEDIDINIDTLADGRYELVVSVADAVSGEQAESRTAFCKGATE